MRHTRSANVSTVLGELAAGDASAVQRLLPLVYDELRALAAGYFRGQPQNQTLQPTALVHEAYLRMVDQTAAWKDRAHFLAVAALALRQILADHARRRAADKRGGGWGRVTLDAAVTPPGEPEVDLEKLDAALGKLESLDERRHRVVVLRFFGGLAVDDVAEVLGVSKTTAESDWRSARAWLSRELGASM
jgi:RNA polymerase sigma factor (TIGR02999 family)